MTERMALYGGTFDPFHCGHLDPVRAARAKMGWSEVIYIPAWRQPFKVDNQLSSPFHRHAMAVLGTEDEPWMRVSVWELERNEISYTVDTLRHFVNSHPDRAFDWIIGDDNLQSLTRWRSLDEILSMANFAVLRRTGSTDLDETLRRRVVPAEERQAAGGIVLVDNEPVVVSATAIRDRLSSGLNATGLVPPRVERYIRQNRLYANQEDLH